MMEFYTLWCEWDYGQAGVLFTDENHGKIWLEEQMREDNTEWFTEEFPDGIQAVFDEHLAGFEVTRVFTP